MDSPKPPQMAKCEISNVRGNNFEQYILDNMNPTSYNELNELVILDL